MAGRIGSFLFALMPDPLPVVAVRDFVRLNQPGMPDSAVLFDVRQPIPLMMRTVALALGFPAARRLISDYDGLVRASVQVQDEAGNSAKALVMAVNATYRPVGAGALANAGAGDTEVNAMWSLLVTLS